jgi:hypothetical protein
MDLVKIDPSQVSSLSPPAAAAASSIQCPYSLDCVSMQIPEAVPEEWMQSLHRYKLPAMTSAEKVRYRNRSLIAFDSFHAHSPRIGPLFPRIAHRQVLIRCHAEYRPMA